MVQLLHVSVTQNVDAPNAIQAPGRRQSAALISPSHIHCFPVQLGGVGSAVTGYRADYVPRTGAPLATSTWTGWIRASEITIVRGPKDPTESRTDVEVSVLHRETHTLIRLGGEIDFATVPGLRERLFGLLRPGAGLVILDLSGVSFCDASGLGVLVGSHHHAATLGLTLRLTALPPRVADLLHLHGLDRVLAIYPAPSP
jgi:anti-anti-sigma factor